jgi:hypothetical protein
VRFAVLSCGKSCAMTNGKGPNDANEQQHAELVEACERPYPNLTDEEIEEFLRAHGARSPHQIDSDRGFSAVGSKKA